MIVIRTGRLTPEAGTGPRTATSPGFFFDRPIRACSVGLAGYRLGYGSDEQEVQTMSVELACAVRDSEIGRGVFVDATLLLRDSDGHEWFSGWADFILFVELGDFVPPVEGVRTTGAIG